MNEVDRRGAENLRCASRWPRIVRPLLGVAVLLAILATLDLSRMAALLSRADWRWFALAVLLTFCNQFVSAFRWQRIASGLGLGLGLGRARRLVFQALAGNAVLPGGIVAGEAWRIAGAVTSTPVSVPRRGALATASILLDRISGLWALSILSLSGCFAIWRIALSLPPPPQAGLYASVLVLAALAPLAIRLLVPGSTPATGPREGTIDPRSAEDAPSSAVSRLRWLTRTIRHGFGLLIRALPASLLVQACAISALFAAYRTVGATIDGWWVIAAAAMVFVVAALPVAIGGFGARELAAVAVFVPLGMTQEMAFTGSVIFGLSNTAMGVLGALSWMRERRR